MTDQYTPNEVEVIDVEAYAKAGQAVPTDAKYYRIKIDKEKYTVDHAVFTGREILLEAGLTPVSQYRLDMKLKGGGTKKIELEDTIDLRAPGVEKFLTLKLDQTEG
ncbi:multiubiquitin domain-containing protein [Paenibacillus alkaliterrae]|uniref:multiubiquitin domain-containing protein n=1 Tax=Paenibacillus alkaliterrae TaxID=320909 RepID=UPI001F33F69E|nr:multiubiquitin domain-containing protein [Paenibacillus alkaliterrae]MCF2940115.1 multiubiquitin domain-containing protein [Paenibacillus alkaliterrae]